MDAALAITQWVWAPAIACAISCVYFIKSPALPLSRRLAASFHGSAVALLYVTALLVYVTGLARASFAIPFWLGFLLPLVSVGCALIWLRGALQWLLFVLLACAASALFIGTMAVTGDWL